MNFTTPMTEDESNAADYVRSALLANATYFAGKGYPMSIVESCLIGAALVPPSRPVMFRNLARINQLQGNTTNAIKMYRRYLQYESEDGEAHHNLGLLYQQQGRATDATAEFEIAALLLSPDDPETATNLGIGYYYRGELEIAVMLYERAIELDPDYLPARYHAGITYLYLGRIDESLAALEAVVLADSEFPSAVINLGVAYNTAGRPQQAVALFSSLLERDPYNPSAILNLGYAYNEAGEVEMAAQCFNWCVENCDPETPYVQKAAEWLGIESDEENIQEESEADGQP